ncbi:serine protease inhibitor Kazal-type 9 [Balaenoptera musculus]|uniref:Serine protease inhibitor Kazal-type 9 n=1 Tax=Balaenoptera musculus TaxID=9771 RepID=A0A8B8X0S2_BALMU|nr:serine protease inhibitor Kazal-type 9 [Balaenoptera musculus]
MRATAFVLLSALALTTIFTDQGSLTSVQLITLALLQELRTVVLNYNVKIYLSVYVLIDCSNYKKLPPVKERVCYAVYAPIHVSDGKTYSNDCYFCYEVKKVLK